MKPKDLHKKRINKAGDFTFHTRVKDAQTSPIDIAILWCQVIHIEINWCIAWAITSWFDFGKYAKTGD